MLLVLVSVGLIVCSCFPQRRVPVPKAEVLLASEKWTDWNERAMDTSYLQVRFPDSKYRVG